MMLARNSLVTSHPGPSQRPTARRLLLSFVVICVTSALAVFTTLFLRERASSRRLTPVQITLPPGPVASSKPSTAPVPPTPAPAPNNKVDANAPENAVPPSALAEPTPAENPADLVARTHAELKMLEDTTDRRYTEFSLARSKGLRLGSIKLQLRKIDSRNRSAQVSVWTGNASLGEKHAALFEPVEIPSNKSSGAAFLVLTQISVGRVSGYVTEPIVSNQAQKASVHESPRRSRAHKKS